MQVAQGEILRRWQRQEFVDYEGLHLPDDTIVPIRVGPRTDDLAVEMLPAITLAEVPPSLLERWDGGDILCEHQTQEFLVRGGERHSHGSGGFVAVSLVSSPSVLLWLAVLHESNPFVSVSVAGRELEAISSRDEKWRFALDPPYWIIAPRDPFPL
jgi:hypothetical protein